MRRRVSFSVAALLLLLALSLSVPRDASAEVDAYDGEDDGQEEASNSVGLEYEDDYDAAVGEGRACSIESSVPFRAQERETESE